MHPSVLRCSLLLGIGFVATSLTALPAATGENVGVARLHSAAWVPGDDVRDGAGEFAVFLQSAHLQRHHRAAGLVVVGDRNGMLRSGGERALRMVVYTGVAIVKLAPGGVVAKDEAEVFLTAGDLSPDQAEAVLRACLARYGAPPAAAAPDRPTVAEIAAIRAHLQPFQEALLRAGPATVARL